MTDLIQQYAAVGSLLCLIAAGAIHFASKIMRD
jgi:hypothetical protein